MSAATHDCGHGFDLALCGTHVLRRIPRVRGVVATSHNTSTIDMYMDIPYSTEHGKKAQNSYSVKTGNYTTKRNLVHIERRD
jgi:hypothetical protein